MTLTAEIQRWISSRPALRGGVQSIQQMTPDMGTRTYYRVQLTEKNSLVLCHYNQQLLADNPFFQVHSFLKAHSFSVPEIIDAELSLGLLLLEDLSDQALSKLPVAEHLPMAIQILEKLSFLDIQSMPPSHSIRRSALDFELFIKEMNHTALHLLENLFQYSRAECAQFVSHCAQLFLGVDSLPRVVCHRDFHVNNIFLKQDHYYMIDFQDMRLGFGGYDLFSLLFEREALWSVRDPLESREGLVKQYWKNSWYAQHMDWDQFFRHFLNHGVQRCLKALGSFAKFKTSYAAYIGPSISLLDQLLKRHELMDKTVAESTRYLSKLKLASQWKLVQA